MRVALCVVHELERHGPTTPREHGPRMLPPDSVDRVRMVAEIARELVRAAGEREPRIGDAVGVGNERIRGEGTYVALRDRLGGCGAQHVTPLQRERGDRAADR